MPTKINTYKSVNYKITLLVNNLKIHIYALSWCAENIMDTFWCMFKNTNCFTMQPVNKHVLNTMNETLEQLSKRISSLIPTDLKHMQDDLENNIHSLLQTSLSKMNLVTREEFDVQSAVLQRTREKLEQLEKQLELLKNSTTMD